MKQLFRVSFSCLIVTSLLNSKSPNLPILNFNEILKNRTKKVKLHVQCRVSNGIWSWSHTIFCGKSRVKKRVSFEACLVSFEWWTKWWAWLKDPFWKKGRLIISFVALTQCGDSFWWRIFLQLLASFGWNHRWERVPFKKESDFLQRKPKRKVF